LQLSSIILACPAFTDRYTAALLKDKYLRTVLWKIAKLIKIKKDIEEDTTLQGSA